MTLRIWSWSATGRDVSEDSSLRRPADAYRVAIGIGR